MVKTLVIVPGRRTRKLLYQLRAKKKAVALGFDPSAAQEVQSSAGAKHILYELLVNNSPQTLTEITGAEQWFHNPKTGKYSPETGPALVNFRTAFNILKKHGLIDVFKVGPKILVRLNRVKYARYFGAMKRLKPHAPGLHPLTYFKKWPRYPKDAMAFAMRPVKRRPSTPQKLKPYKYVGTTGNIHTTEIMRAPQIFQGVVVVGPRSSIEEVISRFEAMIGVKGRSMFKHLGGNKYRLRLWTHDPHFGSVASINEWLNRQPSRMRGILHERQQGWAFALPEGALPDRHIVSVTWNKGPRWNEKIIMDLMRLGQTSTKARKSKDTVLAIPFDPALLKERLKKWMEDPRVQLKFVPRGKESAWTAGVEAVRKRRTAEAVPHKPSEMTVAHTGPRSVKVDDRNMGLKIIATFLRSSSTGASRGRLPHSQLPQNEIPPYLHRMYATGGTPRLKESVAGHVLEFPPMPYPEWVQVRNIVNAMRQALSRRRPK